MCQGHPTPVLLPGKSHGRRSLVGCRPWGREESNTTEQLHFHISLFMHWRRKWQPSSVFLPGESQGWGSLGGCHPWGRTESDTTEATQQQQRVQAGQPLVPFTTLLLWMPSHPEVSTKCRGSACLHFSDFCPVTKGPRAQRLQTRLDYF